MPHMFKEFSNENLSIYHITVPATIRDIFFLSLMFSGLDYWGMIQKDRHKSWHCLEQWCIVFLSNQSKVWKLFYQERKRSYYLCITHKRQTFDSAAKKAPNSYSHSSCSHYSKFGADLHRSLLLSIYAIKDD